MPLIRHKWRSIPEMAGTRNQAMVECQRCGQRISTALDLPASLESRKTERCERAPLTDVVLQRMGIGKRYWGAELEDLDKHKTTPYGPRIQRYAEQIHTVREKGVGLFLWGDNSLGKTHTAALLLKEAARVGYTGLLIHPSQYPDAKISGEVFDAEEDVSLVERIETVDFLVLDDVGKEYTKGAKGSGWFELNLERMWRERAKEGRVTHVTTNLTQEEFGQRYSKSVRVLVIETMVALNVKGADFRVRAHKANRKLLEK